jgi:hypothetical protein
VWLCGLGFSSIAPIIGLAWGALSSIAVKYLGSGGAGMPKLLKNPPWFGGLVDKFMESLN